MPLAGSLGTIKPQSNPEGKAMANAIEGRLINPWRVLGWGGAVALLLAPLIAMRFTSEVNWTASDFIFAGILFALIGGAFELAIWASRNRAYRAGAALALLGAFLTIWANLAVGIVGSEDNPATQLFFVALLVGILTACIGRFRAKSMSLAALVTAVSLGVAFVIAVMQPTDEPFVPHIREAFGTGIFASLFLASSALFRKAEREV
jgi:peptidoglycan/LPS O-acetylase OafA/YrhL